ncbi:Vitamin B12 transporter BtuB [Usitatibacter rugosus]|uniref:Vitamin B12 transporter BtuB n=1 Tax=Usitatibacter rugosus TaxID=2732067 RepID=A0A6M4GV24_9PROT|nr:TonB-dependent receptor [Usitatibacter rugosus]QJR10314.1 Vitamin B12 transporter BtuB [Usitatibacter rugosus]
MKQLKRKTLYGALVQALGTGVALSVIATGAAAQQTQKVEKIEVTGSNIKRLDMETVAPVEIITRDQIERTGLPTVAEVIRNVPAAMSGSFNESFSNSFAPGASGVSLRGLGQKTTLVLINGRRTAGYGFAQNLQDTFVDLNSIPTSAVERIEILKDGASAIYGSDAIAGVVNIILRKDFKGLELNVSGGYAEGDWDTRLSGTWGMGDLAKDRWNVFGVVDYYKRDELLQSDTKFLHTRDMRGYEGGRNFQSLTGGGTWRQLSATNALTANHRAISECAGQVIDGPEAVRRGLIGAPAGNTAFNIPGNTFCSVDFKGQFSALPGTERVGFMGRGTKIFSDNMTGYVDVGYSQVKTDQTFQAASFVTTALQQTSVGLRPFAYTANFAPGSAGNPFTSNARYVGVQNDIGTRNQEITSDTFRILGGLTYTVGSWDFDSALSYSKNEIDQVGTGRLSLTGMSQALGIPSGLQPPIPLSSNSSYNLDRPSTNSQAVRDAITLEPVRKSESELKFIDTKASTELWQMAGGPAGLALGIEFRDESLKDRPDAAAQSGDILGQGITATDGSRTNTSIYGEISLPITRSIEAQLAARYDHYSDYGNSTTPKVGVKWRPLSTLVLRANWGKGFRAPTLVEISPSVATFFTQVADPNFGGAARNVSGSFAGNPNLEPEKSTSLTAGFVWEPTRDFSLGMSYYEINWKNIVVGNCCQDIVDSGDPTRVIRDPVTGEIVTVVGNFENQAKTEVKGIDLDARYAMSTDIGKFTGRVNWTYFDSFKENDTEVVGSNAGTNTIPRAKGVVGLDWDYRAFSATVNMNYTHGYHQTAASLASYMVPQDPQFQNGIYPEKVRHFRTVDIYARYNLNKNFQINASLVNAEDKTPPYDPGFSTTNLYDFSLFDIRGRQWRLGLKYTM